MAQITVEDGELSTVDFDTLAYACQRVIIIKKLEGEDEDAALWCKLKQKVLAAKKKAPWPPNAKGGR